MCSKVSESSWEQKTSTDSFSLTPGLHDGIAIAFLIQLAVIIMIKNCKNSQLGLLLITEKTVCQSVYYTIENYK